MRYDKTFIIVGCNRGLFLLQICGVHWGPPWLDRCPGGVEVLKRSSDHQGL